MAKRHNSKKSLKSLNSSQKFALIAVAVLVAGIIVYGDSITGFATAPGTITFTISETPSFSITDNAATVTTGSAGDTVNTTSGANEMLMQNTGNTVLDCGIKSDEATYLAIFGGSTGSPHFKYYSYDKSGESGSATHTASQSAEAAIAYSGATSSGLVDPFYPLDTTDEVQIGFEIKFATDATAVNADTTGITIDCVTT